jgi:hypothetical protein
MPHSSNRLAQAFSACVLFLGAFAGNPALAAAPTPQTYQKVAYIGHSLIPQHFPDMVGDIARSLQGITHIGISQSIPGTGIGGNWIFCRASTIPPTQWPGLEFACDEIAQSPANAPFTAMMLTDTNNPIIPPWDANDLKTTPADFEKFLDVLLTKNPGGRSYYFTQWESLGGNTWTPAGLAAEVAYFEKVVLRVEELAFSLRGRSVDVTVVPANLALQELLQQMNAGTFAGELTLSDIFEDSVHMNNIGDYYLACVVFASIYERSPVGATGLTHDRFGREMTNLPGGTALKLQQLAWNVVAGYRGWVATTPRPKAPANFTVN